jgi:hypothetical protein
MTRKNFDVRPIVAMLAEKFPVGAAAATCVNIASEMSK